MKQVVYKSKHSPEIEKTIDQKSIAEEVIELMKENALLSFYMKDGSVVAEDVFGNVLFDVTKNGQNGKK